MGLPLAVALLSALQLGPEIAATRLNVAAARANAPGIASDGTSFLSIWTQQWVSGFAAARVSEAGELLDVPSLSLSEIFPQSRLVWNGSSYVGVARGNYRAALIEIARDGTRSRAIGVPLEDRGGEIVVAWNGSRYLIVNRVVEQYGGCRLEAVIVDDAYKLVADRFRIDEECSAGVFAGAIGDTFVVAENRRGRTVLRTMSGSGEIAPKPIDLGPAINSGLACNGTKCVTAMVTGATIELTAASTQGVLPIHGVLFADAPHEISMAANATNLAVAWSEDHGTGSQIYTALLDDRLQLVQRRGPLAYGKTPAVSLTADAVAVAYLSPSSTVQAITFPAHFSVASTRTTLLSTAVTAQYLGAAAATESGPALWWIEHRDVFPESLFLFGRFDRDGQPLDLDGHNIPEWFRWSSYVVAASADLYLLVAQYGDSLRAIRIAADGTFLDKTPIVITKNGRHPVVTSDGRDFVVAWSSTTKSCPSTSAVQEQIAYAAYVRSDGFVSAERQISEPSSVTDAPIVSTPLALASNGNGYVMLSRDATPAPPCYACVCTWSYVLRAVAFSGDLTRVGSPVTIHPPRMPDVSMAIHGRDMLIAESQYISPSSRQTALTTATLDDLSIGSIVSTVVVLDGDSARVVPVSSGFLLTRLNSHGALVSSVSGDGRITDTVTLPDVSRVWPAASPSGRAIVSDQRLLRPDDPRGEPRVFFRFVETRP